MKSQIFPAFRMSLRGVYAIINVVFRISVVFLICYDGMMDYALPYIGFPTSEQINSHIVGSPTIVVPAVRRIEYDARRNRGCQIDVARVAKRLGGTITNQEFQIDSTSQTFARGDGNFQHSGYDGTFRSTMYNGKYRVYSRVKYNCNLLDQIKDRVIDMDPSSNVIVSIVCGRRDPAHPVPEDDYADCPAKIPGSID